MFRILRNFRKIDFLLLAGGFLLIAAQVGLELKMPDYMSEITKLVQTPGSEIGEIYKSGGMMLLCAFLSFIASIGAGYIFATISASLSMNTRKKLFDKIERLDMESIKQFSTSSLITRTTNDITQIQMFVAMGAQMLIRAPMFAIWAITKNGRQELAVEFDHGDCGGDFARYNYFDYGRRGAALQDYPETHRPH